MEQNSLLVMEHINKSFPGVIALKDVQFSLRAGEIHALLGENGAGKSTLIKVLTGIEHMDDGTVIMDGSHIAVKSPLEAQKHGISTVYQEVNLCPHLTVAENIYVGREPLKFGRIDWKEINKRSKKLLEEFELDIDVTKQLDQYSVAVQQMIAIARAVDVKAKILILDEPTRGIDIGAKAEIQKIVMKLAGDGMSCVFISSEMEEMLRCCSRMFVLRSKEIVAELTGEQINESYIMQCIAGEGDAKS